MVSFVLLFVLVILMPGFAAPLHRAMGEALAFVRDPSHRVLPVDPWVLFREQMKRRLRLWPWVWITVALGAPALFTVLSGTIGRKTDMIQSVMLFTTIFSIIVGVFFAMTALAIWNAPRMPPGPATLITGVVGPLLYLAVYIGWAVVYGKFLQTRGAPIWLIVWERQIENTSGSFMIVTMPLIQFYLLPLLALALWGVWRRARRRGAAWFRFEQ